MKRTASDRRWSKIVRTRDFYTCQRCGAHHSTNSQGLHAAHVFSRGIQRTRCRPDNGIALCRGCHVYLDSHKPQLLELAQQVLSSRRYNILHYLATRPSKTVRKTNMLDPIEGFKVEGPFMDATCEKCGEASPICISREELEEWVETHECRKDN